VQGGGSTSQDELASPDSSAESEARDVGGRAAQGEDVSGDVSAKQTSGVHRDPGDGARPIVATIQTNFADPRGGSDFQADPAGISTYDDASLLANDCWVFLDEIAQIADPLHPRYDEFSTLMAQFDGFAERFEGIDDRFGGRDLTALTAAVASANALMGEITGEAESSFLELEWSFPALGITRRGTDELRWSNDASRLATWVLGKLQPFAAAAEASRSSPFAARLATAVADWETARDITAGERRLTLWSNFEWFSDTAVPDTTALLTEMNAVPVRVLNVALGAAWELTGTREVTTYDSMIDAADDIDSALFFRRRDILGDLPDTEEAAQTYEALRDQWSAVASTTVELARASGGDTSVTADDFEFFEWEVQEARRMAAEILEDLEQMQRDARRAAATAKAEAEAAIRQMRDLQRQAFLANAEDDLPIISTALDAMGGSPLMGTRGSWTSAIPGLADKAFTWGSVIANWATNSPLTSGTPLEGLAALNNAVSVLDAINSTWVNPMLIVTSYVGPMLAAITTMLGRLQTLLIAENDAWAEAGYDIPRPQIEPGGAEMWSFMRALMAASSANGVPRLTGDAYDYIEEYRDRFDAATRSTVPTDGGILGSGIDKDVDADAFGAWAFAHREDLWGCLYGSRRVPTE
jgi:hypothetical protein